MKKPVAILAVVFALVFNPAVIRAGWAGPSTGPESMGEESAPVKSSPVLESQASSILGKLVENKQGQALGRIGDLIISPQDGGISFAVVTHGGIMGIPMSFVAVPFESLAFSPEKNVYLLNVSKERMDAAPSFARGTWPDAANPDWAEEIYRYYGQTPQWGESEESIPRSVDRIVRYNQIAGAAVRNEQGKELGKIDDIVVDSQGHVPYAVLLHGGFLGMGGKLIAVPFGALEFKKRETEFVLNATEEKLDSAPAFKPGELADPKWIEATQRTFNP